MDSRNKDQAMNLRAVRPVLLFLLIFVMGAGQVCACVHPPEVSAASQQAMHHDHDIAGHHSHGDQNAPSDKSTGCDHCEQFAYLSANNVGDAAALPLPPAPEKAILVTGVTPSYVPGFAPEVSKALAWLDPPLITPVTLKVRLLH